jgi:lipopolysaccharide biosynthesis glycosyltransferase
MDSSKRGFITILTGLYSFQDCVHFLASIRKFHQEPILVLIDQVPIFLHPLLKAFGNVTLKQGPSDINPVLASRKAKVSLHQYSPFEKTIYLDCDICLLTDIDDVFEELDIVDLLVTKDVQPSIANATNLIRGNKEVLQTLQAAGLPVDRETVHYNSGLIAFKKTESTATLFCKFQQYFQHVLEHQDNLRLRDQGAFAAAIATTMPTLKILPPTYNFLDKWKNSYHLDSDEFIKVLHATYPYRPQYAKNITRSPYTRIFDKLATFILPNQVKNPWRSSKGTY